MAAILIAVAFAAALFFNGTDSLWLGPVMAASFAGCALLVRGGVRQGGALALPLTPVVLFLCAFWGWMAVSLFFSRIPYISTMFFWLIGLLPMIFLALLAAPARWTVWVLGACGGVAVGMALWALIQFAFFYDVYGPRIHHPLMNPNNLAALFNMSLLIALGFFLQARTRGAVAFYGVLFALFLAGLLMTQSRAAFLLMAVCVPLLLLLSYRAVPDAARKIVFIIGAGIVVGLAMNYATQGLSHHYLKSLPQISESHSFQDRLSLWQAGVQMWLAHPIVGGGLASFSYDYPAYRPPSDMTDGFFVHMDPLQFALEMGAPAALLFYGLLAAVLWRMIRAARVRKDVIALAVFLGLSALVFHSHISFHLYMPALLMPAAVALAFWYRRTQDALGDQPVVTIPRGGVIAVFAFLACGFIWGAQAGASIYFAGQADRDVASGHVELMAQDVDPLCRFAPLNSYKCDEYQARLALARLSRTKDKAEAARLYERAQAALDRIMVTHAPLDMPLKLKAQAAVVADGLVITDGRAQAIALLTRVLAHDPLALDVRMMLARLYQKDGAFALARAVLEDGLNWPRPRTMETVHYTMALAQLRRQAGDSEGYNSLFWQAKTLAESLQN